MKSTKIPDIQANPSGSFYSDGLLMCTHGQAYSTTPRSITANLE